MKKYIENIRISVKKAGYVPTSNLIMQAINIICPDGYNILDNKEAIINETIRLIKQLQKSNIIGATPSDNNIQDSPIIDNLTPPTIDMNETELSEVLVSESEKQESNIIGATPTDNNIQDSLPVTDNNIENSSPVIDNLTPPTIDVDETESSEITVSESEKQDLITSQASVLGFNLSEEEASSIAETVDEIFNSYNHLIDSISIAIKAYFDNKFDSVEEKIGSNSENLREHFANRKERLNKKIAGFKDDVKADLGGIHNDIKSVQFGFTRRLAIPVKT